MWLVWSNYLHNYLHKYLTRYISSHLGRTVSNTVNPHFQRFILADSLSSVTSWDVVHSVHEWSRTRCHCSPVVAPIGLPASSFRIVEPGQPASSFRIVQPMVHPKWLEPLKTDPVKHAFVCWLRLTARHRCLAVIHAAFATHISNVDTPLRNTAQQAD